MYEIKKTPIKLLNEQPLPAKTFHWTNKMEKERNEKNEEWEKKWRILFFINYYFLH